MGSRGSSPASFIVLAFALVSRVFAQEAGQGIAQLGWDELYALRLDSSAACKEAAIGVKTATLTLEQYVKPYVPVVSLSTSASKPFSVNSSGFTGGSLIPSLGFERVFGADVSLKMPLKIAANGSMNLEDPSLSVSRKLFTEEDAARLDAEAALLNARASRKNAEDALRISLAKEIADARYYESMLEANRKNLEILGKVRKATTDATTLRELERRILAANKAFLSAKRALDDISAEVKDNLESLTRDLARLQGEWNIGIESSMPETSLSIEALELTLEAAEKRQAFALLPYLPNPSLTAELYYDTSTRNLDWSLSFSLSYDVADKGRKSFEVYKRKEYPGIYRAKLAEARKSISSAIGTIQANIESLELDLKIQRLDIEDAQDELSTMQALYQGGFANEESLVIAQIDFSVECLDAEKIEYDILMQKLNLAKYYELDG